MKKMVTGGIVGMILLTNVFPALGCTLVGANGGSTDNGAAYLASTSDNPYLPGPRKPVYVTLPQNGGYKFVHTPCLLLNDKGFYENVGSDRGMNETGFSWTRSWVVPNEEECSDKMSATSWFRKLGSTVSTVDEAIEFVKDNPKGVGCQGNYIFADANGNLAVVEVGFQTVTVAGKWGKEDQGLVARANRWESEIMKALDISSTENPIYYNTSEYRYNRAMELLEQNKGKINADILKEILSDRNPQANSSMSHLNEINNHGVTDGTVSAEVYDIAEKTFWYTYGWMDDDKSGNTALYGENKNSWEGKWIPFKLSELTEEGYYTTWDGQLTEKGERYLESLEQ